MCAVRTESVERAMSILNAFSAHRPTMSLAALAEETGLHKSTILRLTNSMSIYGFIQRDSDGQFSIGPSVWRLGLIFRRDFISREKVAPALRVLVRETGETASFYVRSGDDRVCLYRENSPNLLRYHVDEGMRLRLSTGASGMVLRHFGGEPVEATSGFNPRGTIMSEGETHPDIASVSTPVFSAGGELQGALTVSGLSTRFDRSARQAVIPRLEELALHLSRTDPGVTPGETVQSPA